MIKRSIFGLRAAAFSTQSRMRGYHSSRTEASRRDIVSLTGTVLHTAGGCLVAGSDTTTGTGSPVIGRGIQTALAFDNLAVQRNAVARAIPRTMSPTLCVLGRDDLDYAVVPVPD